MSAADLKRKKKAEEDAASKAMAQRILANNHKRVLANHERKQESERLKAAIKF